MKESLKKSLSIIIVIAIIAILLFVLISRPAAEPTLSVSATASDTNVLTGDTVTFLGVASGGTSPYTYDWNFDNLGSSNLQNPSFIFIAPGTYNCKLTANDVNYVVGYANVMVSVTDPAPPTLTVTVNANPKTVVVGNNVNFYSTPSGGVPPYTYSWSFKSTEDIEIIPEDKTLQNPVVKFTIVGDFKASVVVTDSVSSTVTSAIIDITVTPEPEPQPLNNGFSLPTTIEVGDIIWANIYLDPPSGVHIADQIFTVTFDPLKIEVQEVVVGNSVWNLFDPGVIGTAKISDIQVGTIGGDGIDYKTTICKIKMRILDSGETILGFEDYVTDKYDPYGPITLIWNNYTIEIIGE